MGSTVIEVRSVIGASAELVWARVVTPEGINDEMRPWLTMSMPRGIRGMDVDDVPVGTPVGRAWLRLFAVLPFDYDLLTIAELDMGTRFLEESTMLSMSQWRHERIVTPEGDSASVVQDRVAFTPRIPLRIAIPILTLGIRAFFTHRHRRLQRHFS